MKKIILDKDTIIELINYYNTPHSLQDTAKKFAISRHKVSDILIEAGITKRTKEQAHQMGSDTLSASCIEATGYSVEDILQYYLQPNTLNATCLKFGLSPSTLIRLLKNNQIKEHDDSLIAKCRAEKAKQTCLKKYGQEFYSSTQEFKARYKATSLKNFGAENPMRLANIASKQLKNRTATCLKKYNTTSYFATAEFKEKAIKTRQARYNVSYSGQINSVRQYNHIHAREIQQKINITKQQNNSFNSSKVEDKFYLYLLNYFKKEDILAQYGSDSRYPFNCDFYIKSKDLFIELNISWTHGGHPFNVESVIDQNKLANWKEKAIKSDYYKNAIEVWTIRDQNKITTAKTNNLNYLMFYTEQEALNYNFKES